MLSLSVSSTAAAPHRAMFNPINPVPEASSSTRFPLTASTASSLKNFDNATAPLHTSPPVSGDASVRSVGYNSKCWFKASKGRHGQHESPLKDTQRVVVSHMRGVPAMRSLLSRCIVNPLENSRIPRHRGGNRSQDALFCMVMRFDHGTVLLAPPTLSHENCCQHVSSSEGVCRSFVDFLKTL